MNILRFLGLGKGQTQKVVIEGAQPASADTKTTPTRYGNRGIGIGHNSVIQTEDLTKALEGGGIPPHTQLRPEPQVDKEVTARMNRGVEG